MQVLPSTHQPVDWYIVLCFSDAGAAQYSSASWLIYSSMFQWCRCCPVLISQLTDILFYVSVMQVLPSTHQPVDWYTVLCFSDAGAAQYSSASWLIYCSMFQWCKCCPTKATWATRPTCTPLTTAGCSMPSQRTCTCRRTVSSPPPPRPTSLSAFASFTLQSSNIFFPVCHALSFLSYLICVFCWYIPLHLFLSLYLCLCY